MKGRVSLLKTLTCLDRCSKACLARFVADCNGTLTGDVEELAQTSREIVRVQLNMIKLSRELAAAASQIRQWVSGRSHGLATPALVEARNNPAANKSNRRATEGRKRFAFAAVIGETGAVIVRVLADTSAVCPQEEYGCFETWTEAQDFATVLNQTHGIDPMEARYIVVSASLALQSAKQAC